MTGAPGGMGAGAAAMRAPGGVSVAYDRLLLAHLCKHLPHSVYEAVAETPLAQFFLSLLHEFLLAPEPAQGSLPNEYPFHVIMQDARLQYGPGALHAARLVAIHILANPSLRRGCEQQHSSAQLTRVAALLLPALVTFVNDLAGGMAVQKQRVCLEPFTSLMKLWLVLLQPWKAPRLHAYYAKILPPQRQEQAGRAAGLASFGAAVLGQKKEGSSSEEVDVALLGLEPEKPAGPLGGLGSGSGSGATARLPPMVIVPKGEVLAPGHGDARSWRSYVQKLHTTAYGAQTFARVLVPGGAHRDLCWRLTKFLSDSSKWPNPPDELKNQNLNAVRVMAQALLCFTDPVLISVLKELPPGKATLFQAGGLLHADAGASLRLAWAAVLAGSGHPEIKKIVQAVSRHLATSALDALLPPMGDAAAVRVFAKSVLEEAPPGAIRPAASSSLGTQAAAAPIAQFGPPPRFHGSEWERPIRQGEAEVLLHICYTLALLLDWIIGREPRAAHCGAVPQTEWPRLFASRLVFSCVVVALLFIVFW